MRSPEDLWHCVFVVVVFPILFAFLPAQGAEYGPRHLLLQQLSAPTKRLLDWIFNHNKATLRNQTSFKLNNKFAAVRLYKPNTGINDRKVFTFILWMVGSYRRTWPTDSITPLWVQASTMAMQSSAVVCKVMWTDTLCEEGMSVTQMQSQWENQARGDFKYFIKNQMTELQTNMYLHVL